MTFIILYDIISFIPRKILISLILFIVVLLSSCVDYVQSITYKDERYYYYNKITFSKLLMELTDKDVDAFMEDINNEYISSLPSFVSVKPVNTDIEVGAEISFSINPNDATPEGKLLLPKKSGKKYLFPFMFAEDFSDMDDIDSSDGLLIAIMSSAKCRVMISKKIISVIDIAYFEGRGGEKFVIPVFNYGDSFCLEIPLIVLFDSSMYDFEKKILMQSSSFIC